MRAPAVRTALILGGADTLYSDVAAFGRGFDGTVVCNDAGVHWPGKVDAWVSMHPEKFGEWTEGREVRGFPAAGMLVSHIQPRRGPRVDLVTGWAWDETHGAGSSGLFAAKVALVDLGFDMAVLCGIPLTPTPHFFRSKAWKIAPDYQEVWRGLPEDFRARMRSMSGWTREFLGAPEVG